MKYLGFGDNALLNQQLEELTEKVAEGFELYTDAFFDEHTKLEAKLYFRHSDKEDRYFFNKYDALLLYPKEPIRNRAQTFYTHLGKGITFKESFNLLQGRSVFKNMINLEGEKYQAWVRLDFGEKDSHDNYKFKQYGLRYGYELEKVLEDYPIRELQNEKTKAELYRSLQRGNLQLVTFDKPAKAEKVFIEANPMSRRINIYPQVVKVAKKIGGKHQLAPTEDAAEDSAEHPTDPLPGAVPEEETDVAEDTAEVSADDGAEDLGEETMTAAYPGKGQAPVPEYTMVKKATTRKRVRK
jgi:hypothetical protein